MSAPITVKWTLGDTFRARVSIDDLFDPTTEFTPVYGEIYAKLKAASSLGEDSTWDSPSTGNLIEIRLSGSKEYVPLKSAHRSPTLQAGRARLRICDKSGGTDVPMEALKIQPSSESKDEQALSAADTDAAVSEVIRTFLAAGSYEAPIAGATQKEQDITTVSLDTLDVTHTETGKPLKAGAAPRVESSGTQAVAAASLRTTSTLCLEKALNASSNEDPSSTTKDSEFATKSDVLAMIDAKLKDMSLGSDVRKHHGLLNAQGRHGPHWHAHGHAHGHGSHGRSAKSFGHAWSRGEASSASEFRHNAICDACDNYILGARYKCLDCPDYDSCDTCWATVRKDHATHRFVKITDDSLYQALSAKPLNIHWGVLCDGQMCTQKKTPINGDRYKCAICPDFDLCASCEANPGSQHTQTHPLIKIKTPISSLTVSVDHSSAPMADMPLPADATRRLSGDAGSEAQMKQAQQNRPSPDLKEVFTSLGAKVRNALTNPDVSRKLPVRHLTVACDNCNRMVCGARFMCATCKDFDLCESCYSERQHPASHVFVRYNRFVNNIITPRLRFDAVATTASANQHKGFYCNECHQTPINGLRYHCLVCKDYDSCEKCKDLSHDSSTDLGAGRHLSEHAMQIVPASTGAPIGAKTSPEAGQVANVGHASASEKTNSIRHAIEAEKVPTASPEKRTAMCEVDLNALSADFLEDLAIPDGTVMTAGAKFCKQWLVRNDGPVAWPSGIKAVHVGGMDLSSTNLPNEKLDWPVTELEAAIQPGQASVVSVFLEAPDMEKNNVVSYFKLVTPTGHRFGCKLWVDIDVQAAHSCVPDQRNEFEEHKELENVELAVSHRSEHDKDDKETHLTRSFDTTSHSAMILPSASMELPKSGPSSNSSVSNPSTQHEWGSEDEITLSDDDDYDVLDDESFSDDN